MLKFIARFKKTLALINKMCLDNHRLMYDITKPRLIIYSFMYLWLWENTEIKLKDEISNLLKSEDYPLDINKQKRVKHLSHKLALLLKTDSLGNRYYADTLLDKTKKIFKGTVFV